MTGSAPADPYPAAEPAPPSTSSRGAARPAARPSHRHRLPASGRVGLVVLAAFAVLAVAGPSLAGGSTTAVSGPPLAAPGWGHWLGTNAIGQDLARQWLTGARTSLTVGLLGGGGTFVMSTIVGAIAGWWGGLVDAVLMRLTDVGLVLPTVVVVIVISAYTHPTALSLSAVIAGTSWPASARLIRSQVLTLRGRAYLAAAAGFGASRVRVLWRHVLPDSALVLVAAAVRDAERAIAYEAGLAFLGLTVSTEGSWGTMLHDALAFQGLFLTHAWLWWLLPPVLTIAALLGALALSATAVDDRVNPRAGR